MKLLKKSLRLTFLFVLILVFASCEKQDTLIDDISIDQQLNAAKTVVLDPGTIHQINYLNSLIDDIEALVEDGTLNQGQANALIVKIENSIKSLENGNDNAAENQLGAFINEAEDFVENGVIPEEIGESFFEKIDIGVTMIQSEVVYSYIGNNFNLFSGGSNYLVPEPDPLYTSYTTSDFVTVVITLDDPLPGDLNLENIRNMPGYSLSISDGHQVMTIDPGFGGEVLLSTDTDGNIIAPWSVIAVCCLFPNNTIATVNWPGVRGIGDNGYLTCPNGSYPDTPRDGAIILSAPGVWASDINTP